MLDHYTFRQLPSEYKMFTQVDKSWKDIMRNVEDRPNALKSAIAPGTLETLQSCNASLEKIQKCLEVTQTNKISGSKVCKERRMKMFTYDVCYQRFHNLIVL